MAAGKHGGYRSNEFKDRESVLGFRRDDYYYRCRSGEGEFGYDREVEWRKERYDRHTIKPRCKDVKRKEELREESKDEYRGCSALSRKTADREPGELYSGSDSDGAILYDSYGMEVSKTGKYVLLPPAKKQKFSPIVWDKEAKKQQHQSFVTKICDPLNEVKEKIDTVCFSSVETNRFHGSQPSPSNTMGLFGSDTSKSSSGSSTLSYQEQQESSEREMMGQSEEEGFVPTWKVPASRWADEEEGELREMTREGSEGIRAKSLESYKGHRSSSEGEDPLNELDGNEVTEVHEEDVKGSASTHYSDDSEEENYPCGTGKFPRRSVNMLQECRSVYEFERLNKINEGTYGVVFKARDKRSGEIVALKKVKMEKEREGFPLTALREINILLSSHHPSIVDVKEVVMGKNMDEIYMVMEYMEHDLKGLMETMKHPFSLSEVKCLMLQLLEGVKYLHDNWVLHRDLKTSNLLMNNQGELKICDFGLSRQYGSPSKPYTPLVVTLWYRAPELLLGAKQYSTAIDMWSLGCIMAELLAKEPLFSGKSEVDQLQKIFSTLGTPTETIWPGFSQLPGVKVNFVKHQHNLLRRKFPPTSFIGSPILSDAGFDLLSRLLTYDPEKRITAEEAVNHQWFHEVPLPKSKDFMPTFPPQHTRVR